MTRVEKSFLLVAAFLQGLAIVTVTSSANIFIHPSHHGLTEGQYGTVFIPNILVAIVGSFLAGTFTRRFSVRGYFLCSLFFGFLSMACVTLSGLFYGEPRWSLPVLWLGLGFLGVSFSGIIAGINAGPSFMAPEKGEAWLNLGHGTTGLGTVGAPLLVGAAFSMGVWPAAPGLIAAGFAALMTWTWMRKDIMKAARPVEGLSLGKNIFRFKDGFFFAAVGAFSYGLMESHFANWWTVMGASEKGFTLAEAGWGLTLFWLSLTFGRFFWSWHSGRGGKMTVMYFLPLGWGAFFVWSGRPVSLGEFLLISGGSGFCAASLLPFFLKGKSSDHGTEAGFLMGIFLLGFGLVAFVWPLLRHALDISWEGMFRMMGGVSFVLFVMMLLRARARRL